MRKETGCFRVGPLLWGVLGVQRREPVSQSRNRLYEKIVNIDTWVEIG